MADSVELMRKQGHRLKEVSTTGPGTADEIARRCLDQGADLILVAGGDGTINEVANGMVYSNVPLGILPGGTANVLATETGIGGDILEAASRVGEWIPERVSLGIHQDGPERPRRLFLLMCGAGLDAHIVYHLGPSVKALLGKAAYWIGGFSHLARRLPEFEVEANGQSYRTTFALVSRVRNYGGDLAIAPSVSLLDDDFEVVLFQGATVYHYVRHLVAIGAGKHPGSAGVEIIRARELRLSSGKPERVYTQIDGEYAGNLPVELDILPRCLTLLLPQAYRRRRTTSWTTSPTA